MPPSPKAYSDQVSERLPSSSRCGSARLKAVLASALPVIAIMVVAWMGMLGVALGASIIHDATHEAISGPPLLVACVELAAVAAIALVWLVVWHRLTVAYRRRMMREGA